MMKTAFLFPGQGSQAIGMGKELADKFAVARQTFQEADAALGLKISQLCFEGPEDALRLTDLLKLPLGSRDLVARAATKDRVLGQSQNVADAVGIAPPHQSPAAEPAVATEDDFDVRPSLTELIDQKLQHGAGVLGGVDIAGPEIGREQFVAAEDV